MPNNTDKIKVDTKIQATLPPKPEVGIDLENNFQDKIIEAADVSSLDLSKIEAFSNVAQTRDQIYSTIDTMCLDSTLSAVLDTYVEDTVETNDKGQIVWAESNEDNVGKYVNFLLQSLKVDKNIHAWALKLTKYGDLYWRLYKQSDLDNDDAIFKGTKQDLKEAVNLQLHSKNDHYTHYIEAADNPSELFELTRFGKTAGYIQAPVTVQSTYDTASGFNNFNLLRYKVKRKDISVFSSTDYVHACLEDNSNRVPEEVNIFTGDSDGYDDDENSISYKVRRGESIFSNSFKVWRELSLLENSILLNRLTKSSIVRVLNVEVGDMPKEQVDTFMGRLKSKIEQKSAIDTDKSMAEYTNPGPIENTIYIPTHEGKGAINAQTIGGDVDVKALTDLSYFQDKLFGSLKVPKQFFGCLRGNTPIILLDGTTQTIGEMFNNKDRYLGKGILACSSTGKLIPTTISNIMLTKPATSFLRIQLDNGNHVDVTPDHRMMLRDGTFVFAEDLAVGDSLMPYYDKIKEGRRYVLDNEAGKYKPQFRVVAEAIYNIPAGYQVHHIDMNKFDDDFINLEPLTIKEHYAEHFETIHVAEKLAAEERKLNNSTTKQAGSIGINNGIENRWIKSDEVIPEGFYRGHIHHMTEENKKKQGERIKAIRKGVPSWSANLTTATDERLAKLIEKSKKTRAERSEKGMYDQVYAAHSQFCKNVEKFGNIGREAQKKYLEKYHPERIKKLRYLRCPVCGKIFIQQLNDTEYEKYLSMDHMYYCSGECRKKIDGGGKLARSYKLYLNSEKDFEKYTYNRSHAEHRADFYFYADSLKSRLEYLDSYVPECNHKVVAITTIDVSEPAYDISVSADCHTFALPCGIFVHNCTEDSAGFSGGKSLSIISSRYGKSVKRIQNTLCQGLTDIINLFLLDSGLTSYIGKFTIRMQAPITQEEIDTRENKDNRIRYVSDVMQQLNDIQDPAAKLKILKSLLSDVINDPDIIAILQDEIDKLEQEDKDKEEKENNNLDNEEDNIDLDNKEPADLGPIPEFNGAGEEQPTETEEPIAEEPVTEEQPENTEDSFMPSPADLDQDMTQNQ